MKTGVQWTSTLAAHTTKQWFTHGWSASAQVLWTIVPTYPLADVPQIGWRVSAEHAQSGQITYWITVENLTSDAVEFEGRYAIVS